MSTANDSYNQLPLVIMKRFTFEYWVKLASILLITLLIIVFNVITILTLHSRHYLCHLRELPKTLMTSLALTDLSMGLFVTPVCLLSAAKGDFPFSKQVCELQALLISSLFHSSSLLLISIALDRYICINYPLRYRSIMTKKVHLAMSIGSVLYSFGVYTILIFPHSQYTFDTIGLFNCEPFYHNDRTIIIIAFALFFIPSILVILYCYSAIFLVAQRNLRRSETQTSFNFYKFEQNQLIRQRKRVYSSLIILAAISLGFVIAISPWSLVEFCSSVYQIRFSANIEFITTWIAISNSFWNPVLYGLLNKHFRVSCHHFLLRHTGCARIETIGNYPKSL